MAGRLADKVAIVTGAASGIGQAVTALFVREGARVVFADSCGENGASLEEKLRSMGGETLYVETDVTKTEDLQYLVNKTIERYGRIDVLVNNICVAAYSPDEESDIGDIIVKSHIVTCREVLPHMVRQGKGSVVNTAVPGAVFAAGRDPVEAFTRALACEYADQGIRVNCIALGFILDNTAPADNAAAGENLRDIPMGRAARTEEIAWGYVFFASDESSFCTGSTLAVDGGASAMSEQLS